MITMISAAPIFLLSVFASGGQLKSVGAVNIRGAFDDAIIAKNDFFIDDQHHRILPPATCTNGKSTFCGASGGGAKDVPCCEPLICGVDGACVEDAGGPTSTPPPPTPTSSCGLCVVDNITPCSAPTDCPTDSSPGTCTSRDGATTDGNQCTQNSECEPTSGSPNKRGSCDGASTTNTECDTTLTCPPATSPVATTLSPTKSPSLGPTASPTQFTRTYSYTNTGTSKCDGNGSSNYQGPAPLPDKSDVAIQFFAFGDTPYDDSCNICNTCLAEDGSKEDDCSRFTCTVSNNNMDTLEIDNTCTYEGNDYICLRDTILPYMQNKTTSLSAFSAHVGDIIKGKNEIGSNRRCTDASFTSRKDLFGNLSNFLLTPGDNDWNECYGYDITSNSDPIRQLWREHFAEENTSPFHQFSQDFPLVTGGGRPNIQRQSGNPENFYFEYNSVAFIGLNLVAGSNYIESNGVDLNAQWVQQKLSGDSTSCNLKSIVVIGHTRPSTAVNTALGAYFDSCLEIPVLTISGNSHPSTYCMSKNGERLDLTVEAFRSGPILVSIVRDPNGGDYFHVDDADLTNSNTQCPSFA